MEIEVDYNPSPSKTFFISISLNNKEAISFDYTTKGHRIIKQILVEKKAFPKNAKINGEWDAIVLKNMKFVKKYHVQWIDMDKKDWVNDEIWETIWEKPISDELTEKLLYYSQLISDNYEKLDEFSGELRDFESFLSEELSKHKLTKKPLQ